MFMKISDVSHCPNVTPAAQQSLKVKADLKMSQKERVSLKVDLRVNLKVKVSLKVSQKKRANNTTKTSPKASLNQITQVWLRCIYVIS